MARKTTKICPLCGREFLGTDGKITCSNACRTAAVRFRQKGKKMEYALLAKTKGQKLPTSKLIKAKPEKPLIPQIKEIETNTPEATIIAPESLISPSTVTEMTVAQKLDHNAQIDKRIHEQRNKRMPAGMFPKMWGLQQADAIKELENQKIALTNNYNQ